MKPHWYHILLALSAEPRRGLAIGRAVQESSGGRMRLYPATLYGSLAELMDAGWIEEIRDEERRPDASERKRYYGITAVGRRAFDEETKRLADLLRRARAVARKQA